MCYNSLQSDRDGITLKGGQEAWVWYQDTKSGYWEMVCAEAPSLIGQWLDSDEVLWGQKSKSDRFSQALLRNLVLFWSRKGAGSPSCHLKSVYQTSYAEFCFQTRRSLQKEPNMISLLGTSFSFLFWILNSSIVNKLSHISLGVYRIVIQYLPAPHNKCSP